ncbi:uncharacterized protein LOC109809573 [Cajanus cajan]|uniref:Uncharacterized protein n=1 Tax=Cajanus cajan TaxID=3821 RepID=A0A151SK61_CAJCA|nr:uncharacterized protein LOC109809573 [Cajanus cajan]KYP55145.1 hypothetical protein KK1_001351 [Cajanus cajan]
MNRNGFREEKSFCYFHPKQLLIGVCPLCLNERLLIVAAKQGRHHHNRSSSSHSLQTSKPSSSIHKIFAFGSLFTRHESHHCKSHNYDYDDVSPSPEESFISIKFEENGVASWEKSTVSLEKCNKKKMLWKHEKDKSRSVIEHGKSRDLLRWRRRIGHMFQLIRWKKGGGVCHVGTKVRKGWMRTLTKRKTTME